MNSNFRDLLKREGPIIFDGAMGTSLQSAGLPVGTAPEEWNLSHPESVRRVHTSYVETGVDVICIRGAACLKGSTRMTKISRKLCKILRHGAVELGLMIQVDGFCELDEVLKLCAIFINPLK